MTWWQAGILGLVQGLTEFLPVSSSGHLVLFHHLLGFREPPILIDVLVHVATLAAVLLYYRQRAIFLIKKYFIQIGIGTIPAVVVGLFLKDTIEALFSSLSLVAMGLAITGIVLILTKYISIRKEEISPKRALLIGLAQALAITPGISRSGSTIAASLATGISKEDAFDFSFMLAIPAILGALVLQLFDIDLQSINVTASMVSFLTAFCSGYMALKLLKKVVVSNKFYLFGWYCLALSSLLLILNL